MGDTGKMYEEKSMKILPWFDSFTHA